ncbi:MAG TPA: hypothetical protein VNU68_33920 [Verrucomicrobiae bacterium]|nr:hypothetical protein [Verrucomicrobiae bacterium]
MKLKLVLGWSSALCLGACALQAQETKSLDEVQKQLQQMKQAFDKLMQEQQKKIEELSRQLEELKKGQAAQATNPPAPMVPGNAAQAGLEKKPWSMTDPIRIGNAQNYLNISFDGLFAVGTSTAKDIEGLETGGHDPKQRGFTVENVETTFEGKVDPYFRAQAAVVLQIDPQGESFIELEEAYADSMSLPANLQLRAGQFFTEFGRQNQTHPHAWDFVDQPLVMGRFLGDDGLRSAGARLSWLMPTPFYSELYVTVQNSQGPTVHSFRNDNEGEPFFGRLSTEGSVENLSDLLITPRYAASFNLSDEQTIVVGASGAFGNNGTGGHTELYGLDLFWKWKPVGQHAGFPFVSWTTEPMLRRYEAGAFNWDLNGNGALDPDELANNATGLPAVLPRETLTDYGIYSQVLYGFHKGWVAGLRGDYVAPTERAKYETILGSPDLDRASRWRLSPNLTWYVTEFSKLRLQYNYDQRDLIGVDHSVWLQFEFLLGAHAAHKF